MYANDRDEQCYTDLDALTGKRAPMLFTRQSPPPFYQPQLTPQERERLDRLFIGSQSTDHYLKAFAKFDRQQRMGMHWNWAGFMMTLPWMLYRKRFLDALVYTVAGWSLVHVIITLLLVINENAILPFIAPAWHWPIRGVIVGVVYIALCILTGLWADAYYYRCARREISETIEDHLSRDAQAQKLKQEGGISLIGGALVLGLWSFALALAQFIYLPMYASYQLRNHAEQALDIAEAASQRVEQVYQATGRCPVELPLDTSTQQHDVASLRVQKQTPGTPAESPCQLVATLHGVAWPAHSFNGQQLVLARPDRRQVADYWNCTTSLTGRDAPIICRTARYR